MDIKKKRGVTPPWEGKEKYYYEDGADLKSLKWGQKEFDIIKELLTGKSLVTEPNDYKFFDGDLLKEEVIFEVSNPSDPTKKIKTSKPFDMLYHTQDLVDFWVDQSTIEPEIPLMGVKAEEEPIPATESQARNLFNFIWYYRNTGDVPDDLYYSVINSLPFKTQEEKDQFLGVERFKASSLWKVLRADGIHSKVLFAVKQIMDDIIREAKTEGTYDLVNPLKTDIIVPLQELQTPEYKKQRIEYVIEERFFTRRVSLYSNLDRKNVRRRENGNLALIIKDMDAEKEAQKKIDKLLNRITNATDNEDSDKAAQSLCDLWVNKNTAGRTHMVRLLTPLLAKALNATGKKLYNAADNHEKNRVICLAFGDPQKYVIDSWQSFFLTAVKKASRVDPIRHTQNLQGSTVWKPTECKGDTVVIDVMAELFRQTMQTRLA